MIGVELFITAISDSLIMVYVGTRPTGIHTDAVLWARAECSNIAPIVWMRHIVRCLSLRNSVWPRGGNVFTITVDFW